MRRKENFARWGWRAFFAAALVMMLALASLWFGPSLPHPEIAQPDLLDRNGRLLEIGRRSDGTYFRPILLAQVSEWMIRATLCGEDRRYWLHFGLDPVASGRALLQNLRAGRRVSGGSTLTQQMARGLYRHPRTLWAKMHEAWAALSLEVCYSKREILQAYFNTVWYGPSIQGIEAAAWRYFGKRACDLNGAESIYLAAVSRFPARREAIRSARVRRAALQILARLLIGGEINRSQYLSVMSFSLPASRGAETASPHWCRWVRAQIRTNSAGKSIPTRFLRTTLDMELQERLQEFISDQVALYRGRGLTNAAAVVLHNPSGEVLSWVGSSDFDEEEMQGQVDGVLALRQPGSALKPFLYAAAFEEKWHPASLVLDEPTSFRVAGGFYTPENYDERFHGPVRARVALACSYNVPAVKLADEYSVDRFLEKLRALHFKGLDKDAQFYGPALALGVAEVRLIDLAQAYAALARGGIWAPSVFLRGIEAPRAAERVFTSEAAFLVSDILADRSSRVATFGSPSALDLPFAVSIKTGTSKDFRDNWAVAFTPEYTVAAWAGDFKGHPMWDLAGASGAVPIVREMMLFLYRRSMPQETTAPETLRGVNICTVSGKTATPGCRRIQREWFASWHSLLVCEVHLSRPPARERLGSPESDPQSSAKVIIEYPRDGMIFKMDPNWPASFQAIRLRARCPQGRRLRWRVNGKWLSQGQSSLWRLRLGTHVFEAALVDDSAPVATARVHVVSSAVEGIQMGSNDGVWEDTRPSAELNSASPR